MTRGGSRLVCSDQCSAAFMCLFLRASSLATRVSRQVSCGLYLPGSIGMKSLIGRPNTHIAGDNFVSESGVFRYWRIARWTPSVSSSPLVPVLLVMRRSTVFTPISALQLLCGNATDESWWCTPQVLRKRRVVVEVNSGPPSDASSSGIPYVTNERRRLSIRPSAPPVVLSTIGQFEYLSTMTR